MSLKDEFEKKYSQMHGEDFNPEEIPVKQYYDPENDRMVQGLVIPEEELKQQASKQLNKDKAKSYYLVKDELARLVSGFGNGQGFFFFHYKEFLEELDDDYALAFRFLYLSTYANYDGILCESGSRWRKGNILSEKDIFEKLRIKHTRTAKDTVEKMFEKKLLKKANNGIKVNDKYCFKGNLPENYVNELTRVFIYGVRTIYEQSQPREHKKIGRIISLLTYTHVETNILCCNPETANWDDIVPLTLTDIGKIIGYGHNDSKKIKTILLSPRVDDHGFIGYFEDGGNQLFVVNPHIFYRGSNIEKMKWLKTAFSVAERDDNNPTK